MRLTWRDGLATVFVGIAALCNSLECVRLMDSAAGTCDALSREQQPSRDDTSSATLWEASPGPSTVLPRRFAWRLQLLASRCFPNSMVAQAASRLQEPYVKAG